MFHARTTFRSAAVVAALAVVGCGTQKIVTTPTPTPAPTSGSTTPAAYLGPPCSQMDAQNTSGYSMCDSGGSSCPNGWQAMQNPSGACEPGSAPSSESTTSPTQTVTQIVTQTTQAPAPTSTEAPAPTSTDNGGGSQAVPSSLVNEPLDVAESDLDNKGISYHVLGGGTFGVVVKGNWGVCSTRPSAGQPVPSDGVGLVVGHFKCGVS
jgi:hypothetical protein